MWKKNKYYIIIAFFILAIWLIESAKPKPINWFESYSMHDKIPYGNRILFDELPSIFEDDIHIAKEGIKEHLQKDSLLKNYLFINDVFKPNKEAIKALLDYVSKGHNAMVISRWPSDFLLDTLGLSLDQSIALGINDSLNFKLASKQKDFYHRFSASLTARSFSSDSIKHYTDLGYVSDSLVNFVKVPFGNGYFFMHLNPLVFTNYHMLMHDNHEYISAVLSHLPNQSIYWDEYYKSRKAEVKKSHLWLVLSTDGLRQALYLMVFSLLVYMLFASKRKQGIIPVVEEKANDTLNFTRTIGQLYYNVNNNKDIGQKRIDFFMSNLRKRYQIFSETLDDDFCEKLHQVSGVSIEEIKKLVVNFNIIRGVQNVSDDRIIEQDKLIESFYSKTRYHG